MCILKSGTGLPQVLIDPERRQVYDIYGKEGLEAGLEVGPHLRTRDELRRQWQHFQQQQVGWPAHGIAVV
jgi:DnaJ-class molecular chaperone